MVCFFGSGCLLIFLLISGCAALKSPADISARPTMIRLPLSMYPVPADDLDYDGLDRGIQMSLAYLNKLPQDRSFRFGPDTYTAAHLIRSLEYFQKFIASRPPATQLSEMIRKNYQVYRAAGDEATGRVLFTGYYEPLLNGSSKETAEYRYPVFSRPDDLTTIELPAFSSRYPDETLVGRCTGQKVVPYYDRKTIGNGAILKDHAQVLAWVRDPVDLFFLQIQGSGKIHLEQGSLLNVHYHITNGHPYRSIGKILKDQGKIPGSEISMQTIRSYLKNHPQDVETVLNENPSYVFFKIETDGPLGNLNVPLTPGRSVAVDRKLFPPAALMYIQTQKPVMDDKGRLNGWESLERFALNQDTGGAITGSGRADIFWGNGSYAELAAGYLQHRGEMYFLVLNAF